MYEFIVSITYIRPSGQIGHFTARNILADDHDAAHDKAYRQLSADRRRIVGKVMHANAWVAP